MAQITAPRRCGPVYKAVAVVIRMHCQRLICEANDGQGLIGFGMTCLPGAGWWHCKRGPPKHKTGVVAAMARDYVAML